MDPNTIAFILLGLCGLFWAIALTAAIKLHKRTEQASIKRLARICYTFGSLSVATVLGLVTYIILVGH